MNETAAEALQRARTHLHRATLESLEAARALLEVAIQGAGLGDLSEDSLVAGVQRSLEEIVRGLRENTAFRLPSALVEPLETALEAEIERWEVRSQTDPDARPVLRAFLGLRELLWELGLRRDPARGTATGEARSPEPTSGTATGEARPPEPTSGTAAGETRPPEPTRPGRIRVQRFDVED